jgi:hypothetical protein
MYAENRRRGVMKRRVLKGVKIAAVAVLLGALIVEIYFALLQFD